MDVEGVGGWFGVGTVFSLVLRVRWSLLRKRLLALRSGMVHLVFLILRYIIDRVMTCPIPPRRMDLA